ncbi:hypothetical protein OS493_018398 [Desmophyllum pertusum]|uniref:FAD-binding FR-type domain-containing protein n=1 Tax=Desmophyllum pertusum TaxID=174260 RepID=A0A9X0A1G6_9CNID|nr:hypothetical protein OS493_018398 [Desmophyllum pertusum]
MKIQERHRFPGGEVVQHGEGVVEAKMKKQNFTAAPGQYVFIKCADVSRFEWHRFTLTQCPSSEDASFSIHCKSLGDWTEKFADRLFLTKSEETQDTGQACLIQNGEYSNDVTSNIKIAVDGPYGSPCMDVWSYDVSLCIATGIGVTPFAALINELRHKIRTGKRLKLRRLYFCVDLRDSSTTIWLHQQDAIIQRNLHGKRCSDREAGENPSVNMILAPA